MLISEVHREIKIGADKVDSLGYPNFLPEELDVLINNSIEKFISVRLYGSALKPDSFEETQKRTDDLRNLVTNSNITTFTQNTNSKPGGYFITTPTNYWHAIQEDCEIHYTDCKGNSVKAVVPVIPITHDKYNKIVRDPFNKPSNEKVLRLSYGLSGSNQQFELITGDSSVLTTYNLRYIRKPAVARYGTTYSTPTTDVEMDLPEPTHKELVKMVVAEILGTIESQRTGLARQEVKEIE